MDARSAAIVAAVRAEVGTRFRPQGRVPGLGLDCVGVVLVAARATGMAPPRLPAYALGGDHEALLCEALEAAALSPVGEPGPGDIHLFAPAEGRRHFAVQVSAGAPWRLVHAHAGLGRVVEAPAEPGWAHLGAWRFP